MSFDWAYLLSVAPILGEATLVTLKLALAGFALAVLLGLVIAVARLTAPPWIGNVLWAVTEFIRLTPLLVQLFFAFYVLPEIGIKLPAEPTGVIVIGVHYATYTAEVYRAGIQAVARGQWEAAQALGLPSFIVWARIVLPQAVRPMVPALGNYLIQLFKEVPLLSTITVYELLNTANLLAGQSFRYFEILTAAGAIFFALSYPSALLIRRLEVSRHIERVPTQFPSRRRILF